MKSLAVTTLIALSLCACGGDSDSSTSSNTRPSDNADGQSDNPRVPYTEVEALKTLADFPIGMEVGGAEEDHSIFIETERQPVLEYHFDSLVAGAIMKMKHLHPHETQFTFTEADKLVDYALHNEMIMHGHTLIWHYNSEVPEWMKNYGGDWQAMLDDHVFQIVRHYAGRVDSWDVVNEGIEVVDGEAGYRESIFFDALGPVYIENAFKKAREADPQADLYYNDYNISGNREKLDFMLEMIDNFQARDVPIDGVGFQMHVNVEQPPIDMIEYAFRQVVARNLMVRISELDIAVNINRRTHFTDEMALEQKSRYKAIVRAYLDTVPPRLRAGITFWGLIDGETWMRSFNDNRWPLLFYDDFTVKPAFYGVAEALKGE